MLSGLELIWIRAPCLAGFAAHTAFNDRLPYEPNTLYENKKPKMSNVNSNEIGLLSLSIEPKSDDDRLLLCLFTKREILSS